METMKGKESQRKVAGKWEQGHLRTGTYTAIVEVGARKMQVFENGVAGVTKAMMPD